MEVKLPYGKEHINVEIADEKLLGVYYPNIVEKVKYEQTLERELEDKNFLKFTETNEKIVFIVNDGTRPTPTAKIMKALYSKVKNKDIFFIIATGVHRETTEEEYEYIFGKEIYNDLKKQNRIHCHDARKDEMVYLGKSKNGTEMYINKIVANAKKVVVIGSVEPHYFAGYTGGRKGFLPGVAAFKTIEQNHSLALNREAKALNLKGNPVHEDMMDAMKVLKDIDVFAIMTVLDKDHDIYAITTGDLQESFYEAIEKADEVFCVDIPQKAEIVISAAPYPMDIDLYQSQKAIDNGKLALKEGGILIMVSQCRTGIGEEAFFELMAGSEKAEDVLKKIKENYKLGYHKAGKMAEINTWAEMWGVTELDDELIKKVHIRPFSDIKVALEEAIKIKGEDAKIIVLPYGSMTIPKEKIEKR
ncbi:MAG: general glycosylation pathway protein [Fusobacteriia bacterium 4572_132]|nr:MAG: general glycosylation pathway protein [Fusobacteriia bacterium 4572_132]